MISEIIIIIIIICEHDGYVVALHDYLIPLGVSAEMVKGEGLWEPGTM